MAAVVSVLAAGILSAQPGWYSDGGTWTNRKKITIDGKKVAGKAALVNFPLLFVTTDAELGAVARADGADIVFTAADGFPDRRA